jgi:hypothetical protein
MKRPEDYRVVIELDKEAIMNAGFSYEKIANRLNRIAENRTKLKRIGVTEWCGVEGNNNFHDCICFCGTIKDYENWVLPYTISWKSYRPDSLDDDIVFVDWKESTEELIRDDKIKQISLGI